MTVDHRDKKYSIYIAERLERELSDPSDRWYHAFLMLVDETNQPVTIVQQLHFNDQMNARGKPFLFPNARVGIASHERFKDVLVYPLIGGKSEDILGIWNGALGIANLLLHEKIPFDENYKHGEYSPNCRAAVIAIVRAMGFDYHEECFAQTAGSKCSAISLPFKIGFQETANKTIEELTASNKNYLTALQADWIGANRIVAPIIYPFKPMDKRLSLSPR
jgi:hypothetical protein